MAQLNREVIIAKVLKSKKGQRAALRQTETKVEAAKEELLHEFNTDPVTKELEQGPEQPYSEVLPQGYGNLFSFLGFSASSEPVTPVRELLEQIKVIPKTKVTKDSIQIKVRLPSEDDIEKASPMEWENRSWVSAVTYGLGTFSHYMFNLAQGRFNNSRSSTAIQVKPDVRATSFYLTGRRYVIGMLGDFRKKITR